MKLFVLYRSKSSPSAKAFANSISVHSDELIVKTGTIKSKYLRLLDFDYVLNVGNSLMTPRLTNKFIINRPSCIKRSANKLMARARFKAKKIPAPPLWFNHTDIPSSEFPVIGRTSYHMKARGFWYCINCTQAKRAKRLGATHFIKYIKNTKEYRVHIFASKLTPKLITDYTILKTSEKKKTVEAKSDLIKNYDHGYNFLQPSKSIYNEVDLIQSISLKTIHEFGLHYGAVDIIFSLDTKQPYVLEINSTPCLTNQNSDTLDIYTKHFIQLLGLEYKYEQEEVVDENESSDS